ncbi:hypothetical protein AVEN_203708-1 [Araneus ventricosus]|uniref:Uncharacterized protein n=1 Tax=Araneus ventricosus TaxID=182803 RepID=A0A4Y2EWU3_ARAVE|nr:hypothetical protein AVEN_203708-1 [Araneus ventricosus]
MFHLLIFKKIPFQRWQSVRKAKSQYGQQQRSKEGIEKRGDKMLKEPLYNEKQKETKYKELNAKRKEVVELTSREHRMLKRTWQISSEAYRERKASEASFSSPTQSENTPISAQPESGQKKQAGTWSFFESGHGKGAADGIGATLKRCADQVVAHGTDISNAEILFYVLRDQDLKIKLLFVPEEKIGPSVCDTKDKLQVRPGAYVLVNVFGDKRSKGHYRYVGVCHQYDAEDGELKVTYFRATDENCQLFRYMEEDISYVDFDQIISILPNPNIVIKGNRVFYRFPYSIDAFEKA